MHKLAVFEGYADHFRVTREALIERGFTPHRQAEFVAWVAIDDAGVLCGYVVIYTIWFTFDLRPTIVLKELFVEESHRGQQYGRELFAVVIRHGKSSHARLLRWQVLPDNSAAQGFYQRLGGERDRGWDNWLLGLDDY